MIAVGIESATLVLSNVTKDHCGDYTCVAISGIPETKREREIELIVICKYNCNYKYNLEHLNALKMCLQRDPNQSTTVVKLI